MKGFSPLFAMLADRVDALLADKGYDADTIRAELAEADVEAVIPTKSTAGYRSRMIARNTAGGTSLSACSTSSRTGAVSRHAMTRPPSPTSALSPSPQLRC
ncbi:MAG: hypothetical protein ACRYGI_05625, partial [Janthinobacterium lividum]